MTLRYYLLLIGIVLLFATIQATPACALGMVKLSLNVIDEEGHPLDGAKVVLLFQGGGLAKDATHGYTDDQGNFGASGFSSDGVTGGGVYKDGYYKSVFAHDFYVTRFGIWQPWGKKLTVIMRPIGNPVPMYRMDKIYKFPMVDKEVGFDLMKADWVIPYGQGTHADLIFNTERRWDGGDNYDVKVTLTFSSPFDGIQIVKEDVGGDFNVGSKFRLPRLAPDSGYMSKLQKRLSGGTYGWYSDMEGDNNYFFRVRSEVDNDGKLIRAMYGKIRGDLNIDASGHIGFDYYLNPDYTRNLEFDYKRNLFTPLSDKR